MPVLLHYSWSGFSFLLSQLNFFGPSASFFPPKSLIPTFPFCCSTMSSFCLFYVRGGNFSFFDPTRHKPITTRGVARSLLPFRCLFLSTFPLYRRFLRRPLPPLATAMPSFFSRALFGLRPFPPLHHTLSWKRVPPSPFSRLSSAHFSRYVFLYCFFSCPPPRYPLCDFSPRDGGTALVKCGNWVSPNAQIGSGFNSPLRAIGALFDLKATLMRT